MIKVFLFTLILNVLVFGQYNSKNDSLINLVVKSDPDYSSELISEIIVIMYTSEYDSGKTLSDKLLKITPHLKNKSLYINSLIHSYRFYPFEEKIKMLDKASELALKEGNYYLLSDAYMFKATAFRDNSMVDSALIYALKCRDLYQLYPGVGEISSILQLIADIHYYAGEYENAEKLYNQILREDNYIKTTWKYTVIHNNLGLIKIKEQKFPEAENYFLKSLNRLNSSQMSYSDSSGLSYLYRKLLEVSLLQKKYEQANKYYDIGEKLTRKFKQTIELPGYYISKAELLSISGMYDSSLVYLKKAEELEKNNPDLKFKIDLYTVYSNVYGKLGKHAEANKYLSLLLNSTRKSDSLFNRSKLMYTFAEHNYKIAANQRDNFLRERNLYFIILVLSAISLMVILIFFVRLRNSYKMLIKKNLQLVLSSNNKESFSYFDEEEQVILEDNQEEKNDNSKEKNKRTNLDDTKIDEIIEKLEKLMKEEKVYLDPDLSLNSLAQKLNTNRTYLVTAIKKKYHKNFLNFINEYRIKEAILIISSDNISNLNMTGIANKCGYNNRVTFAKIFKQITGVSPSFFINNLVSRGNNE